MKQFRRSRPEASREGVRRAKALLEGEKESGTGRRVLNSLGGIPPHPLLRRIEVEKIMASTGHFSSDLSLEERQKQSEASRKKISDLQKRQEFLRAMANFRPKETVFEAFATGGQKDLIYSSQVDKCANGSAAALIAMKSMRRQMKIARDKGGTLVVAGSKSAMAINGELDSSGVDDENQIGDGGDSGDTTIVSASIAPNVTLAAAQKEPKRRLSKAERKEMKKNPNFIPNSSSAAKKSTKRGSDFRDDLHFIESAVTHDTAAAARSRQVEAAMQPSASSNSKGSVALAHRIEENMLDIVGDENVDLVKRQRMMRWDKSKRKYVQTTVGDELSGESKSKKIRLESGQLVKSDKAKLGELYEKWQKKTNRSIGRVGVFDDVTAGDEVDVASGPVNKGKMAGGKKAKADNTGDEKKTATAIQKEREKKENMKLKNMKKGDRRQLERKKRSEKASASPSSGKKGIKAKKGPSGRWKGNQGKKGGKR